MTTPDHLFDRFAVAWSAGERPDVDAYLAQAPPEERAALADRIGLWLEVAPAPAYDDTTWAAIRAEPAVAAAADVLTHPGGLWPSLLPRLRRRASLGLDELAARIAGPLGITGREAKAARYLDDLEQGRLAPVGVSRRVIDALAEALKVSAAELARAAVTGPAPPMPPPSAAVFRAQEPGAVGEQLAALADALLEPDAGTEPWDDVDELFRGGR